MVSGAYLHIKMNVKLGTDKTSKVLWTKCSTHMWITRVPPFPELIIDSYSLKSLIVVHRSTERADVFFRRRVAVCELAPPSEEAAVHGRILH